MIPDEQNRQQETASLNALNQSFAKIVVVKDDFRPWYDDNGILYLGLFDFLMDESLIWLAITQVTSFFRLTGQSWV